MKKAYLNKNDATGNGQELIEKVNKDQTISINVDYLILYLQSVHSSMHTSYNDWYQSMSNSQSIEFKKSLAGLPFIFKRVEIGGRVVNSQIIIKKTALLAALFASQSDFFPPGRSRARALGGQRA